MDAATVSYLATPLYALHRRLTIQPTLVRANAPLDGVAQSSLRNPGARVIAVIGAHDQLIGVIPLTALIEHLLLEHAAPIALRSTPGIVHGRQLGHHLQVQQAHDLMRPPASVPLSGSVGDALDLMQVRRLAGLPITDAENRVVGYADQLELLIAQQRDP